MRFYDTLRGKLRGRMPAGALDELPHGYQIVGKVLLLRLKPRLLNYRKIIGAAYLELLPYVHAVFLMKDIAGVRRRPRLELLAARLGHHPAPLSQTVHSEHGCSFLLDLSQVMWAAGNKGEKLRLLRQVRKGETIIDMFSGIGYFSVVLAKHSKAKKIYAIDINPVAVEFLRRNAIMNGVASKIEILQGDCRRFAKPLQGIADRIIMGYLQDTEKYLPAALAMAKPRAMIHLHRAVPIRELEELKEKIIRIGTENKRMIKIVAVCRIKSYAPKIDHVVLDLSVTRP